MPKISLFGSTGFIGSRLVSLYPNDFYCEPRENDNPKFDAIVYLIGSNTNYNMFDSLTKDIEDNLIKLNKVLENCRKRDINLIFVSSWFAYGKVDKILVNENDQGEVFGYYSICKKAAEQMIKTFSKVYKKQFKILRLANVYGNGDKFSAKKNALQYLISEIKSNRDIKLYHGGDVTRDFIHVDDCCHAIRFLVDNGSKEMYNVSTGVGSRIGDILKEAKCRFRSSSKFETCQPTAFHEIVQVKDVILDNSNLKKEGFLIDRRNILNYV